MKKNILAAMVLFASVATAGIAQTGAQMDYKLTSSKPGVSGTLKVLFSAQNSRVEMNLVIPQMPGGGMTKISIVKSDKPNTIYSLDDKTKTYTATDAQPTAAPAPDNTITVKVIGKEKIGKYNCTHSQVTKGTEISDYWTTTEIPEFEKYRAAGNGNGKFMGTAAEQAALAKNNADGFMVKRTSKDPRGMEMTMELVSFEKKDIAASQFQIPADYKMAETVSGAPAAPAIDAAKLQSMTPEERAKYIEDLKKQYGTQK